MLAVDAAVDARGIVREAEDLGQLLLGCADAAGVAAGKVVPQPPGWGRLPPPGRADHAAGDFHAGIACGKTVCPYAFCERSIFSCPGAATSVSEWGPYTEKVEIFLAIL